MYKDYIRPREVIFRLSKSNYIHCRPQPHRKNKLIYDVVFQV